MLNINTVYLKEIIQESRLNPQYFRFLNRRKNLVKISSMNFHKIGDEYVARSITDGEHQAIDLYDEDRKEAEIRYLYVHNIKEGIIDLNDSLYITLKDHKRLKRCQLRKGDVLLTIVGTIGKSAMVYDYLGEANIPRNIAKIIINEVNLLPEFLSVFFLSKFGREQSYYSSGGNIQGLLSLTKLRKMVVPVPSKKIQVKIAQIYIDALDKETEALKLIKKAKSHFYAKVSIDFRKFKKRKYFDTDLKDLKKSDLWTPIYRYPMFLSIESEIEKKWPIKRLGELFEISKGDEVGSVNYYDFLLKKSDYVPFVRTSDIANYEIDQNSDYFIPKNIYEELNQDLKAGDILFTNDGKIGEACILTESDQCIIQSHIKRLRLKKDVNIDPYYIFIPLIIKEIGKYQSKRFTLIQSTIPTISNRINDIKIPILEESDRQHIASLVKKAFHIKEQKKKILRKAKEEMDILLNYAH